MRRPICTRRGSIHAGPWAISPPTMAKEGYTEALDTAWIKGTFGYFGFTRRHMELLNGTTGSASRRARLLERAYDAGKRLAAPT